MVGSLGRFVDVLSIKGVNVASGVTNASLVMVGVGGKTTGSTCAGALVMNNSDVAVKAGEIAPTLVGVGYCPHNDEEEVLPMQELINKEIAMNKAGSRFTVDRCGNYTCIDVTGRSVDVIHMILSHEKIQNDVCILPCNLIQSFKYAFPGLDYRCTFGEIAIVFNAVATGDPTVHDKGDASICRNPF